MLKLEHMSAGYGQIEVIHDLSLTVHADEIVAMVGPNGAGKSSLLRTISGLLPCKSGTKRFKGQDVTHCSVHEFVEMGIIQVPEGRRVFGPLTVYENLILGSYAIRGKLSKQQLDELVHRIFDLFPILSERKNQLAKTLSGGEQQMLAIGRGLMAKPNVLLLDEPTLGLAPIIRQEIVRTIHGLKGRDIAVLLVEENVDCALGVANRVCVLNLGRIVLEGDPATISKDPRMKEAYLGQQS